jgi:8-oxo-dGTP pyrophosphatase MutT (NUDIX family)
VSTDPAARPVPVVRLIVRNGEGQVLILRRAGTVHGEGGWCLPGGKVDYGETVEMAVRKELREETDLECGQARFLFYQDSLPPRPGQMHCLNLYFECSVSGDVKLNPESSEWAWVGPGEIGRYEIVFRNDEGLRRYWHERGGL